MRLVDAYPALGLQAPGRPATVHFDLDGADGAEGVLHVRLLDLGRDAWSGEAKVRTTGGPSTVEMQVPLPTANPRGYAVRAEVRPAGGSGDPAPSRASTALLVAEHWRDVPRYGFLSDFAPADAAEGPDARVRDLAKFHLTVIQFYDWMYRHYRYLPPEDVFTDVLGKTTSMRVVRDRVAACHRHGMAALAYGAVYGPEPEFILDHPEWLLYDAHGAPFHLGEIFYITDLRRNGGWRERILREYETVVQGVGFDGIHMDQYGVPKSGFDHRGAFVDLADAIPDMIDEAAERLRSVRPDTGVIFNAVNDWPIDTVATSDQAAVYIEVWPPHERYLDLVRLIRRARDLSGKQVILAAYLKPYVEGGAAADWAARYATAVIAAAGGHHLLLGEGDAVLHDPYYANHAHLTPDGKAVLRRYYDHSAAHTHVLHANDLRFVERSFATGHNGEVRLTGAPFRATPEAGAVWLAVKQRPGQIVIDLVNLTGAVHDHWNAPHGPATPRTGLALEIEPFVRPTRASWSSPDDAWAEATLEIPRGEAGRWRLELPELVVWGTVVIEVDRAGP